MILTVDHSTAVLPSAELRPKLPPDVLCKEDDVYWVFDDLRYSTPTLKDDIVVDIYEPLIQQDNC